MQTGMSSGETSTASRCFTTSNHPLGVGDPVHNEGEDRRVVFTEGRVASGTLASARAGRARRCPGDRARGDELGAGGAVDRDRRGARRHQETVDHGPRTRGRRPRFLVTSGRRRARPRASAAGHLSPPSRSRGRARGDPSGARGSPRRPRGPRSGARRAGGSVIERRRPPDVPRPRSAASVAPELALGDGARGRRLAPGHPPAPKSATAATRSTRTSRIRVFKAAPTFVSSFFGAASSSSVFAMPIKVAAKVKPCLLRAGFFAAFRFATATSTAIRCCASDQSCFPFALRSAAIEAAHAVIMRSAGGRSPATCSRRDRVRRVFLRRSAFAAGLACFRQAKRSDRVSE